jgi:hypothetical protein
MSQPLQDHLSTLFNNWRQVADETIEGLGKETAGLFVCLYSDALDILKAIFAAYPEEERLHSLVFTEFTGLFNELNGFQTHFLCGKYRLVLSELRFNWERIFRARHADTYALETGDTSDEPGPTLAEKHEWLTNREDQLDWRRLIAPTLARLFPANIPADIDARFRPLWQRLNHGVHPSGDLREKLIGASALHVRDAFDEAWARQTHADAVEVFGLIWLAILSRFPDAIPALLADPHTFQVCPQLRVALETNQIDHELTETTG